MTTSAPEGGGRLSREEIDKVLAEFGFLDTDGTQTRTLDREIIERLIEMNSGPVDLDLFGRSLWGANLVDASLAGANLAGATLRGANLVGATLRGANLVGATLRGADLMGADLMGANLLSARLFPGQLTDEQSEVIVGKPAYIDGEEPAAAKESPGQAAPTVDESSLETPEFPEPRLLPGRTFATNDVFDGTDRLDMSKYARALARLVLMAESRPPLTIGIYGEWGSGKSALMELIRKEMESEQEERNLPLLMVDFNAWEHAGNQQTLWVGLTQAIVSAMDKRTRGWRRWRYGLVNNLGFVWQRLKQRWPVMATGVAGGATVAVAQTWPGGTTDMTWALTGLGALFGSPSLFEGWRSGMGPAMNRPAMSRLSMLVKDAGELEESSPVIELVGQMLKNFEGSLPKEFERRGLPLGPWPGAGPDAKKEVPLKTVVFIDDLDRCPPNKVVDVLEGIKLILKDKQFVVFLAVDTRIVSRAIEYRYRQVLQSGRRRPPGELGMEYLAKIVQIPFLLPRPGRYQLERLVVGRQPTRLRRTPSGEGQPASQVSEEKPPGQEDAEATPIVDTLEPREIEASASRSPSSDGREDDDWETLALNDKDAGLLVRLAHRVTQNPRTYNRLGNELRLLRLLLHEDGRGAGWDGDVGDQMIKWLVLCDQWPAFGQYLVTDWKLPSAEEGSGDNQLLEVAQSGEVKGLLKKRYDQAAINRLYDFLEQPPPLSVDTVSTLLPFTTNLTGIYEYD